MRPFTNILAIMSLGCGLLAAPAIAAKASSPGAKVKAGQGCPSLAPVDQWAHRTVKGSIVATQVFCGDFTNDGRPDAIAFVEYNPPGGLGIFDKIALFRGLNGKLNYLRPVKKVIGQPKDASFGSGRIVMDMLTLTDTDPACCPTGRSRVAVNVATGTGKPLK